LAKRVVTEKNTEERGGPHGFPFYHFSFLFSVSGPEAPAHDQCAQLGPATASTYLPFSPSYQGRVRAHARGSERQQRVRWRPSACGQPRRWGQQQSAPPLESSAFQVTDRGSYFPCSGNAIRFRRKAADKQRKEEKKNGRTDGRTDRNVKKRTTARAS
jgi:hypothetical protein